MEEEGKHMEQSNGAGQSITSQLGAQLLSSPHAMYRQRPMQDPHQNNNTERASFSVQATGGVL